MMIRGEGGASEIAKGVALFEKAAETGNTWAVGYLAKVKNVFKEMPIVGVHKLGTNKNYEDSEEDDDDE